MKIILSFNIPTVKSGSYTTPTSVETQAMTLSVDVPLTLSIAVDSQGVVTTAEAVIEDTSPGKIKLENVSVTSENQVGLDDYETDYGKEEVNQKEFGLNFNKDHVNTDVSIFLNPGEESPLNNNVTVSRRSEVTSIIGWDTAYYEPEIDPEQEAINASFTFFSSIDAPNSYGEKKGYFKYIGTDTTVTIPTTIQGYLITDTYKMFRDTSVEKVINTNPNITDMQRMFEDSKATSLDLSDLDTSKVTDMSYMLSHSKATTLDLSNFNTSNVTKMSSMFWNSQATTLDLSNFNTSNVTYMSCMFCNSQATSLDLSSFDTSNVTNMRSMFSSSKATSLDLSSFNTSKVTDMSSMFSSSKATSLDLSSFNTSKVTNMSQMFRASQATSLDLSSFDTSNVTDMSYMFADLGETELDLSSFNTSNVTDMSHMFEESAVTTLNLSSFDATMMFLGSEATTLDLSNFNTSNVTDMSGMFMFSHATTLDLSNFNTSNVIDMSSMFMFSNATTGYAYTQSDADRFNASSFKPDELTFTVK